MKRAAARPNKTTKLITNRNLYLAITAADDDDDDGRAHKLQKWIPKKKKNKKKNIKATPIISREGTIEASKYDLN